MSRPSYLPRFSDPSALHEFDRTCLLQLIRPHADFFVNHNAELPSEPADLDLTRIGLVLLQPLVDTPPDLVDALSHIHEMATPAGMEMLIDDARTRDIALPADHLLAPADVALRVWLHDPTLLRRKHAEHTVLKRRSFDSFLARDGASLIRPQDTDSAVQLFEQDVAAWFAQRGRGRGANVHPITEEHEIRLVVRHGGPYRREGCLNEGEPGTIHFRPMDFHFIVLDLANWELRVNCKSKGERKLYRESIGRHFFGQSDFFDEKSCKYTLEPLRRLGRRSLVCTDVDGMRRARLVELTMYLGGPFGRRRIEQADDVLLALEDDGDAIPHTALLTKGKLAVEFEDSRKARTVSFTSLNRAQYTRDSDTKIIEQFLRRRGFDLGCDHAAVACA